MAADKSKDLVRKDLKASLLVPNEDNPNKMSSREFDLLVDNIQKTGITDAVLVRPIAGGKYRIVGGHHRFKAAQYLNIEDIPCTIITDPTFDDDAERFQIVRMNMIRGRMDAESFAGLLSKVQGKYGDEILAEAFGFADEAEFNKLVSKTAKTLPSTLMQQKFKEGAKEIRTIDGLSKLLNRIFNTYGDTMPYGFLIFDQGGQYNVWLQMTPRTRKALLHVSDLCIHNKRTMDDIVGGLLQRIADGGFQEEIEEIIDASQEVVIPEGFSDKPTKEKLKFVEPTDA